MICWEEDFGEGFLAAGPNARWTYLEIGSYATNDGNPTTSKKGLQVVSGGTNPRTGKPAFVNTVGQGEGDVSGVMDHVKWLVNANHRASSGYLGFDTIPGRKLICETWMSGRTYGTKDHPFGHCVINPDDDLRLASVGMSAQDPETDLLFEFVFTNERIYAFYERLPHQRVGTGNNFASFLYVIPVASRLPEDQHHFKISYDRSAGVVSWILDGEEVYRVDRLGCRLPSREHMMLDHGGVESQLELRQLSPNMGIFSILDGALPGHFPSGLVRLTKDDGYYFNPVIGEPATQSFLDNESLESNRLFGQGAKINVSRYLVSSVPARNS